MDYQLYKGESSMRPQFSKRTGNRLRIGKEVVNKFNCEFVDVKANQQSLILTKGTQYHLVPASHNSGYYLHIQKLLHTVNIPYGRLTTYVSEDGKIVIQLKPKVDIDEAISQLNFSINQTETKLPEYEHYLNDIWTLSHDALVAQKNIRNALENLENNTQENESFSVNYVKDLLRGFLIEKDND